MSTTNGPLHSVRCPSCGKGNDFRALSEQQLLDTGSTIECDHCKRVMEVTRIQPVTVVTVRQYTGAAQQRRPGQLPPPRQASTLSPAQTRRLLKGR